MQRYGEVNTPQPVEGESRPERKASVLQGGRKEDRSKKLRERGFRIIWEKDTPPPGTGCTGGMPPYVKECRAI